MASAWSIRPIEPGDLEEWLRMHQALWPDLFRKDI
jgi:hypothetical protein